jgi:hypothetical protein
MNLNPVKEVDFYPQQLLVRSITTYLYDAEKALVEKLFTGQSWTSIAGVETEAVRTVQDRLSLIRQVFGLSVTQLCSAIGASRVAYYEWQKGVQPAEVNAKTIEHLDELASALAKTYRDTLVRKQINRFSNNTLMAGCSLAELVMKPEKVKATIEQAYRTVWALAKRHTQQQS